jgi:preprotein translocase subunit SecG
VIKQKTMTLNILNVLYVLIALAMTVLILLQRGAGAQAGSGFGAGASATVFGARGAASFLTRSTAILATLFFLLSLGMGWFISHRDANPASTSLGVMEQAAPAGADAAAAAPVDAEVPAAASQPPAAATDLPAADIPAADTPAAPAATPAATPVEEQGGGQQ